MFVVKNRKTLYTTNGLGLFCSDNYRIKRPKALFRNKMYRNGDVILFSNEAKNAAIALAKARLFNEVNAHLPAGRQERTSQNV